MRIVRKTPWLASLLAASLLAGCGEEGEPFQPEPPFELKDPAAYFGVEPCVCYEYRDENDPGSPLRLGVAVENVSAFYSPGQKQVEYILRYRYGPNGTTRRTDFLDPTDPDLLLLRTDISGTDSNDSLRLDPPIPFLRAPVESQDRLDLETKATRVVWDEGGEEQIQTLKMQVRYASEPEKVTIRRTDELGLKHEPVEVEAYRLIFGEFSWDGEGHPWTESYRLFTPELGIVKFQFPIDGEMKTWVLDEVRPLNNCTPTKVNEPHPPTDRCGVRK